MNLKFFLETTEDYVPDGKKRSTHHTKRIDIHRRIANLLKCGYEHPAQNPESQAKKRAKNMVLHKTQCISLSCFIGFI